MDASGRRADGLPLTAAFDPMRTSTNFRYGDAECWYFGSINRSQMTQSADRSVQIVVPMNTMGSPNNEKMLTEICAGSRSASRKT